MAVSNLSSWRKAARGNLASTCRNVSRRAIYSSCQSAAIAAAEADRPKPRRIIGGGAKPIWTVGLLPDRLQDRIFAAALPRMARREAPD
jgi:hypothetical protein